MLWFVQSWRVQNIDISTSKFPVKAENADMLCKQQKTTVSRNGRLGLQCKMSPETFKKVSLFLKLFILMSQKPLIAVYLRL